MKKICAITMIRNEEFFLPRWIEYYGVQLGEENLYIYLDGKDQIIPENNGKANIIIRERNADQVVSAEKKRLNFLSDMAAELLKDYDLIIGVDIDEFLVVDPSLGKTLREYLSQIKCTPSASGLGLDVGQHMKLESTFDPSKSFLSQRSFAILSARYTKPSIISKPVRWGSGFHRIQNHNYRIDKNLYLFHFGCFDMKFVEGRLKDSDRLATGWEKHMKKRVRTITTITRKNATTNPRILDFARIIQSTFRSISAWNKPTMFSNSFVVRIPEKFKGVV